MNETTNNATVNNSLAVAQRVDAIMADFKNSQTPAAVNSVYERTINHSIAQASKYAQVTEAIYDGMVGDFSSLNNTERLVLAKQLDTRSHNSVEDARRLLDTQLRAMKASQSTSDEYLLGKVLLEQKSASYAAMLFRMLTGSDTTPTCDEEFDTLTEQSMAYLTEEAQPEMRKVCAILKERWKICISQGHI